MLSLLLQPIVDLASAAPDRIALRAHGRDDLTYGALAGFLEETANALARFGIGGEKRVATLLSDAPETALCILAVAANAVAVPINPRLAVDEVCAVLKAVAPCAVIVDARASTDLVGTIKAAGATVLRLTQRPDAPAGTFSLTCDSMHEVAVPLRQRRRDQVALLLHTSGSSGAPKRVPLTLGNLAASAENLVTSLALTSADVCLHMMPMFHIGALVDLLLGPLTAGGAVAFTRDISAREFMNGVHAFAPTWFQAVPTVLRDILGQDFSKNDIRAVQAMRFIRAVSQPLPTRLQQEFEARFGTPLIPIFGMTETAGLIASTPLDPGRRKPGSVGQPVGCAVTITDDFGNVLSPSKSGEVLIKGPTVMAGYEEALSPRRDYFREDWFRSGDEGHLDEDGFLYITGRLKDVINRGGEKISPFEIETVVQDFPGIREAAAFAMPHRTLGEEVGLAVVCGPDTALPDEIKGFIGQRLAAFKVPRKVFAVDRLPRLPSGKLDRRKLQNMLSEDTVAAPSEAPSSEAGQLLSEVWRKVLRVPVVKLDDNFFDLGGDSLSATTMIALLEELTGRSLPATLLFDSPTLREMENGLAHAMTQQATPPATIDSVLKERVTRNTAAWRGARRTPDSLLIGRNTLGTKRPFFWCCQSFHQFELMSQHLSPARPLYVMGSLSHTDLKSEENNRALAAHYAREIVEVQPVGPYLLGGYCEGGVVAFNIAKALRAQGRQVALLCLQDRFIDEPYDGPLALFIGKRGWYCQYDLYDLPERAWAKYYSGHVSVFHADTDHEYLHELPYVAEFARQLEDAFARAEAGHPLDRPRRISPLPVLDDRAVSACIHVRMPAFLRQGSRHDVRVEVTNTSPLTWRPTGESGLILASRWLSYDLYDRWVLDARRTLEAPIGPGETRTFDLTLTVPVRSLPLRLDIDIVEDGRLWFSDVGPSGWRKRIIPLPAKHRRDMRDLAVTPAES